MLAAVIAIAGFVNLIMLILGTDLFLTGFAVLAVLYLCYIFGDLYLSIYASKEKSDA
jgi:hypothetical protein